MPIFRINQRFTKVHILENHVKDPLLIEENVKNSYFSSLLQAPASTSYDFACYGLI